jgi:hypothetical protein
MSVSTVSHESPPGLSRQCQLECEQLSDVVMLVTLLGERLAEMRPAEPNV